MCTVNCCHFYCRKQSWLWMQGDIYRAKRKERHRMGERPDMSRILSGVDDMCLADGYSMDAPGSRIDSELSTIYNSTDGPESMTQGDRLNMLKLQRRHTRSAVAGTSPLWVHRKHLSLNIRSNRTLGCRFADTTTPSTNVAVQPSRSSARPGQEVHRIWRHRSNWSRRRWRWLRRGRHTASASCATQPPPPTLQRRSRGTSPYLTFYVNPTCSQFHPCALSECLGSL